jgi:hypothetical protein
MIKSRRMVSVKPGTGMGEMRNAFKILPEKREMKRSLQRLRR